MGLNDSQAATKTAIATAIKNEMENQFPLDEELSEDEKDDIRANWEKLGAAVAEALTPTLSHIADNAEIGTVTTTLDLTAETGEQNNTGTGLIT